MLNPMSDSVISKELVQVIEERRKLEDENVISNNIYNP
jgi:hypothetical protein